MGKTHRKNQKGDFGSGSKNQNKQKGKKHKTESKVDDIEVVLERNGVDQSSLFEIDGSLLEGGGQVLRNGIAYAALLSKPILIRKIRAGRSSPGLRKQHMTGISMVSSICHGRLMNDFLHSTELAFIPGVPPKPEEGAEEYKFAADAITAGSICLVLQAALPCLIFLPSASTCELRGGTNAEKAPTIDYAAEVLLPTLKKHLGLDLSIDITRRGYFPRGGGEVIVKAQPVAPTATLPSFTLDTPGKLTSIRISAVVGGNLAASIADRMAAAALKHVVDALSLSDDTSRVDAEKIALLDYNVSDGPVQVGDVTIHVEPVKEPIELSPFPGCFILLVGETDTGCLFGSSSIGAKGAQAEKVGEQAAKELIEDIGSGGAVDRHMQDQLIIFMALASGTSSIVCGPLELHTETAIHWAQQIAGASVVVEPVPDSKCSRITVTGIGYSPSQFVGRGL